MKILTVVVHSLALTAAQSIQLPVAKAHSEPTLVERRLEAQSAPAPAKPLQRRVAAMEMPATPVALLAIKLDEAEAADMPPIVEPVAPAAAVAAKPVKVMPVAGGHPAKKVIASRKVRTASNSHPKRAKANARIDAVIAQAKILRPERHQTPRRLATFETPGNLMFKALLNKQS